MSLSHRSLVPWLCGLSAAFAFPAYSQLEVWSYNSSFGGNNPCYLPRFSEPIPGVQLANQIYPGGNPSNPPSYIDDAWTNLNKTATYLMQRNGYSLGALVTLNVSPFVFGEGFFYDIDEANCPGVAPQILFYKEPYPITGIPDRKTISSARALDVVAHECGHAVLRALNNPIPNTGESGSVTESFGDIISTGTKIFHNGFTADTWKFGAFLYNNGNYDRNLADPSLKGGADLYATRNTNDSTPGVAYTHEGGGIGNLAFYLLSQGGTHPQGKTTVVVPAIGNVAAERIFFQAYSNLSGTPRFGDVRAATEAACASLFPGDTSKLNAVRLAWEAVGVSKTATLANLSARALVGTGAEKLIGGFVIEGAATKGYVIRVLGSELTQYGIQGALSDPQIVVYNASGTQIAINDNWQTDPNASQVSSRNLAPGSSLSPALYLTLAPGSYTVHVSGVSNTSGVALLEVYDVDLTNTGARLLNLSARARVEGGTSALIGGFVVSNNATPVAGSVPSRNVVINVLGPTLNQYRLTGLPNPQIDLRSGTGTLIRSNQSWQSTQKAYLVESGLTPPSNLEPAVFHCPVEGGYSATVTGEDGTPGIAVLQIFAP